MLKNITQYAVAALAALVIIGCGSNDKGETKSTLTNSGKAVTINGLQSLGNGIEIENISATKLSSSADNYASNSESSSDSMCQSGGMDINTQNNQQKVTFDAHNCNDGYSTVDGSVHVEMYPNNQGVFAEVLRDLTITDDSFSLFATKGSQIKLTVDAQNMRLTTSFEADINGEKIAAHNFSVVTKEDQYGASLYIASGEMTIGEYYFQVDPSHDPSTTPLYINDDGTNDGFNVGGVIKLLDGAGHKIEISPISPYALQFKIDENGDGIFSSNEILVENLEELDFFPEAYEESSSASEPQP